MGFGGISIWQLLIVLVIVLLLFGTKRLRNMGGDLGNAVKGFKKAMSDSEKNKEENTDSLTQADKTDDSVIEGEVNKEKEKS